MVQDHPAEQPGRQVLKLLGDGLQRRPLDARRVDHQQETVDRGGDRGGVAHGQECRRVDDDQIEVALVGLDEIGEATRGDDLTGIGRLGPTREHVETVGHIEDPVRRHDAVLVGRLDVDDLQRLHRLVRAGDDGGEPALVVQAEVLVEPRPSQIALEQDHVAADQGGRHGQVAGGDALALALQGAGDGQRMHVAVQTEKVEVAAQHAVGLGDGSVGLGERGHGLFVCRRAHGWDAADDGAAQDARHLLGAPQARVELLEAKGEADGDEEPDGKAEDGAAQGLW